MRNPNDSRFVFYGSLKALDLAMFELLLYVRTIRREG